MENKKEKIEDFKTAISSTVRSLSNSEKIEVSFGNENPKSEENTIRLPDLNQINNKLNYNQIRAIADSKSLRLRFSDAKTFKQYEPEGNISRQLYRISEKIRCEKIGTSYFKGVKNNIENFYQERISSLDLKSSEDKIVESFENYLRIKFLDFDSHKIDYDYTDVDENQELARYITKINNGLQRVPTLIFPDGSILVEPTNQQLADKLRIS